MNDELKALLEEFRTHHINGDQMSDIDVVLASVRHELAFLHGSHSCDCVDCDKEKWTNDLGKLITLVDAAINSASPSGAEQRENQRI